MWAISFSKDRVTQLTFTCSNSTIETLEKGVDFEQVNVRWQVNVFEFHSLLFDSHDLRRTRLLLALKNCLSSTSIKYSSYIVKM